MVVCSRGTPLSQGESRPRQHSRRCGCTPTGTPVAVRPVVAKRGIEEVIDELVVATMATVTIPERERAGRRPSAHDLAPPVDAPLVMVDSSLLTDIERHVEFRPQPLAAGTIPPPIGAYCLVPPVVSGDIDTDKVPRLSDDTSGEISIDDLLASLPDPEITLDEDEP